MHVTRKIRSLAADLHRSKTAATRAGLLEKYGRWAFDGARASGLIVEILPRVYVGHLNTESMPTRIAATSRWVERRGALSGVASCVVHGLRSSSTLAITVLTTGTLLMQTPDWLRLRRLNFEVPSLIHSGHTVSTLPHALVQAWWDEGPDIANSLLIS